MTSKHIRAAQVGDEITTCGDTTITFKNKTYTQSRNYRNLTLWWTNSAGTNAPWGYEFKVIATDPEGNVLFVGYNFEHIAEKIDNGESGFGLSDVEAVMKYVI